MSGTLPFYADNPDDFLELVLSSSFSFPDSEWADVGEEGKPKHTPPSGRRRQCLTPPACLFCAAQDLIKKILVPDPKKRLTVRQILAHPWLAVSASNHLIQLSLALSQNGGAFSQLPDGRPSSPTGA